MVCPFHPWFGNSTEVSTGLFTIDERTRMTWFQALSFEPLYKFELLGLLVSLAVYNGLTLPMNFPLSLYRNLLGNQGGTGLPQIEDGWPELRNGLQQLLDWSDGDVEDLFSRSYAFSFERAGEVVTVDMGQVGREDPWPHSCVELPGGEPAGSQSASVKHSSVDSKAEPKMVTNENRVAFVNDYIYWLTEKSVHPQIEAFKRGFYVCLNRKSLGLFPATELKILVEGIQTIDVDALETTAQYEGSFSAEHRTIRDFWSVVRTFSQAQLGNLLEFVTASDRVSVLGISSISFVVQRNGRDDEVRDLTIGWKGSNMNSVFLPV